LERIYGPFLPEKWISRGGNAPGSVYLLSNNTLSSFSEMVLMFGFPSDALNVMERLNNNG
jgi:hypothetical protein